LDRPKYEIADKLHALIPQRDALLILGVQRTGTALLASDIASLGFMGTPGEHLLKVTSGQMTNPARCARFAELGGGAGGRTFAVTLMMNYLSLFGKWLDPDLPDGLTSTAQQTEFDDRAMRFFLDRFDRTTVVTLHRDALWEVAYSTWRVSVTNQYHAMGANIRLGSREVTWQAGETIEIDPPAIILCLNMIIQSYRRIDDLVARHGISPVRLRYDEVVGEFPSYLRRVMVAAGYGDRDENAASRHMTKLVDQDELAKAKRAVAAYLGL
jgi:LPS sulfotransferase NodH